MEEKSIGLLKTENNCLRMALKELEKRMEETASAKPGSCQYCKYYVQYYRRGGYPAYTRQYIPVNEGHCTRGVPIKEGGKKRPGPFETCPYFEIGTHNMSMCL